ncbi:MAG: TlpA family protein disulfide reductase [Gemmatimonadales bacterium]
MTAVRGAWCVVLAGVALAATRPATLRAQDETIGIARGAMPPAVQIEDLDGRLVDLSEYVGKKPVVLEFWATWCPLCEQLFPTLEAAQRCHGDAVAFLVIAVAVNQSQRSIRRHLERHPLPFRVLWDTDGRATRAFQAPSTSYVVALDARGRVVYTGIGAEQDIEEAVRRAMRR